MFIELRRAGEVDYLNLGLFRPDNVLMVMLTNAGPEPVLLYHFCCLESGGGLCFTKR